MQTRKHHRRSSVPAVVETMEPRVMLSGVSLSPQGVLSVEGTHRGDEISITQQDDQVNVRVNGEQTQFALADVTRITVLGKNGNDTIALDGADLPAAFLSGGNGNDNVLVVSSNADNVLSGGNGRDLVSTTGQGADELRGGNGRDTLYAIVGAANTVLSGRGKDKLITRDGVETTDASRQDTLVAFRAGEAPGTLRDGVLYLGLGTGGDITISESRGKIVANINGQIFTYDAKDVDVVAGVGSNENDRFVNLSSKDAVFYGAGGDDILIGGRGDDVLKGGGGDDLIIGGGGRDFLTGDAGEDIVFGNRRSFILGDLDDLFASGAFIP